MFESSGNLLKRLTSRLLAVEPVFRGVQRGLHATLHARRALDRNLGRALAALNIPSQADVQRILDQVDGLEQDLDALGLRLERVAETLERGGAAGERRPRTE
jgi:hypothetical protein